MATRDATAHLGSRSRTSGLRFEPRHGASWRRRPARRQGADQRSACMTDKPQEHLDVLIVGAGISGIGAAAHLRGRLPETTFAVLDAKPSYGGTWITHTYPGIRSDSDLHTFGYGFKPWRGKPIAKAHEILAYMGEVIDEHDLGPHIRYHHSIASAEWSSA